MSQFKVTPSALRSAAESLRSQNSQLKAQTDNLASTESSLNSMWEGAAKNAFHNAFAHDKAAMDNFYSAIITYATALETIAAKYEQAEQQNTEIANTRAYG